MCLCQISWVTDPTFGWAEVLQYRFFLCPAVQQLPRWLVKESCIGVADFPTQLRGEKQENVQTGDVTTITRQKTNSLWRTKTHEEIKSPPLRADRERNISVPSQIRLRKLRCPCPDQSSWQLMDLIWQAHEVGKWEDPCPQWPWLAVCLCFRSQLWGWRLELRPFERAENEAPPESVQADTTYNVVWKDFWSEFLFSALTRDVSDVADNASSTDVLIVQSAPGGTNDLRLAFKQESTESSCFMWASGCVS